MRPEPMRGDTWHPIGERSDDYKRGYVQGLRDAMPAWAPRRADWRLAVRTTFDVLAAVAGVLASVAVVVLVLYTVAVKW